MKIIYLHLHKDTYLIFMQAYKPLQGILNYLGNNKRKMYFQNLKIFINSKVKILLKNRS